MWNGKKLGVLGWNYLCRSKSRNRTWQRKPVITNLLSHYKNIYIVLPSLKWVMQRSKQRKRVWIVWLDLSVYVTKFHCQQKKAVHMISFVIGMRNGHLRNELIESCKTSITDEDLLKFVLKHCKPFSNLPIFYVSLSRTNFIHQILLTVISKPVVHWWYHTEFMTMVLRSP